MNWSKLDWDQLPADAGQTVSVEYSVDWESSTIYRRSHDRSDRTVAVEAATITGGEYEPQNGILPGHGEWRPADADTAAAAGRGLHYRSSEWRELADAGDWNGIWNGTWPEIDRDGTITGRIVESEDGYYSVGDEAMISAAEARAGGWEIDAEGYAYDE